jgi:hypothetical protein
MSFWMYMCEEGDFYYLYIWIKLKFIIMGTTLSNLVDSSFEHVLHSYGFHLVWMYKYEIGNCLFDYIYYLLDNDLSFLQLKQNNVAHLNECLLLNIEKTQQCHIWELNPSFLFDLHQDMVTNGH